MANDLLYDVYLASGKILTQAQLMDYPSQSFDQPNMLLAAATRQTLNQVQVNQVQVMGNDFFPAQGKYVGSLWRSVRNYPGETAVGGSVFAGKAVGRAVASEALQYVRNVERVERDVETFLREESNLVAAVGRRLEVAIDRAVSSASSRIAEFTGIAVLEAQNLAQFGQNAQSLFNKAKWASAAFIALNVVACFATVATFVMDIVRGPQGPVEIARAVAEALRPAFEAIFEQMQVL